MRITELPLSKDDYEPERTFLRDRQGFTIAENVRQEDADFIIKCCNMYPRFKALIDTLDEIKQSYGDFAKMVEVLKAEE